MIAPARRLGRGPWGRCGGGRDRGGIGEDLYIGVGGGGLAGYLFGRSTCLWATPSEN